MDGEYARIGFFIFWLGDDHFRRRSEGVIRSDKFYIIAHDELECVRAHSKLLLPLRTRRYCKHGRGLDVGSDEEEREADYPTTNKGWGKFTLDSGHRRHGHRIDSKRATTYL